MIQLLEIDIIQILLINIRVRVRVTISIYYQFYFYKTWLFTLISTLNIKKNTSADCHWKLFSKKLSSYKLIHVPVLSMKSVLIYDMVAKKNTSFFRMFLLIRHLLITY